MARGRGSADPWETLQDDLRAGALKPVYLLGGQEQFLVRQAYDLLFAASVAGGPRGFNEQTFQGESASGDQVVAACNTLPMMGPRRTVVVRNVDKLKAADQEPLGTYCASPSPTTTLILLVSEGGKAPDGRRKFGKAVAKGGRKLEFKKLYGRNLQSWIEGRARDRGKRLDPGGAGFLEGLLGSDLSQIDNCVGHAALYVGDSDRIPREALEEVVSGRKQEALWELLDSVGQRRRDHALLSLQRLFRQGEEPIGVLRLLTRRIQQLEQAAEAMRGGASGDEALAAAGVAPNMVWKWRDQLRTYRLSELRRARAALLDADSDAKGGRRIDRRWVLEQAVIRIIDGR